MFDPLGFQKPSKILVLENGRSQIYICYMVYVSLIHQQYSYYCSFHVHQTKDLKMGTKKMISFEWFFFGDLMEESSILELENQNYY